MKFKKWMNAYFAYWKRKPFLSFSIHFFVLILAGTQILVGPRPFICSHSGELHSFIWKQEAAVGSSLQNELLQKENNWSALSYDWAIWPLLHSDPYATKMEASWKKPGYHTEDGIYFLGTYELGRSVGTNLLYGFRKSLWISFCSVLLGMLIGIPLGGVLSYYHKNGLRISGFLFAGILIGFILVLWSCMVMLHFRQFFWPVLFLLFLLLVISIIYWRLSAKHAANMSVYPDAWLNSGIGLFKSFPSLFLLLLLINWIKKPDTWFMIAIFGFFISVNMARYIRYLMITESSKPWVESLKAIGLADGRIIFVHLIPNLLLSVFPIAAMSMGSVVLSESTLSFLGLGLPLGEISLGSMMHSARNFPTAWWVLLFPGLAVFWMVFSFYQLGNSYTKVELS